MCAREAGNQKHTVSDISCSRLTEVVAAERCSLGVSLALTLTFTFSAAACDVCRTHSLTKIVFLILFPHFRLLATFELRGDRACVYVGP